LITFDALTCASQCLSQVAVKCFDEKTENVINTSDLQTTVNTKEPKHFKKPAEGVDI
jgi:hypothetical protein